MLVDVPQFPVNQQHPRINLAIQTDMITLALQLEPLERYDYRKAPTVTIETKKELPHTEIANRQNERRDAKVAE
ncbi:hypothetical protein [Paenibacillus sp. sgz5001063]|uniref:hypothetical protein n=1 Tax=Paenibacillus sp. sgz5001063 TaxID=3242474 RepID=UPI0036D33140